MIKKNINLIIIGIIILVIISIGIYSLSNTKTEPKKVNLTETATFNDNEDSTIRDLYHQFNPEEGILFNIIGSNSSKDYYAYYYRKNKTEYDSLDNILKTYLTIQSMDYQNKPLDTKNNCYKISLEDLKMTNSKIFPNDIDFEIQTLNNDNPQIDINQDSICIYDNIKNNYTQVVDTIFVNAVYQGDQLIIYERVAFVNITEDNIKFYSDYNMKNEVATVDKNSTDLSFINNLNIVSNVLVNNKNKFNIYSYIFEKEDSHYKFIRIEK